MDAPPARGRSAVLMLGPIVAAALWSIVRLAAYPSHVPTDADYLQAAQVLTAQAAGPGDAVAVLPAWSLRPYPFLREAPLIAPDTVPDGPLDRYRRLFVIAEPDADALVRRLVARLGPPASTQPAGRVRVLRFDLPRRDVRFDFTAGVEHAFIQIVNRDGSSVTHCSYVIANGFGCRLMPWWQRVAREWVLVTENGTQALSAHPPPEGTRLQMTYTAVPVGSRIVISAGHTRAGADRAEAPVRITVTIDGAPAGNVLRTPAFDFHTDVIDTRRWAGATHAVVFDIESLGSNRFQHFAFDAYTVQP
jgi:hypothetical protein